MAPKVQSTASAVPSAEALVDEAGAEEPLNLSPHAKKPRGMHWVFVGEQGLRSGWSLLIAVILYRVFVPFFGTIAFAFYPALANSDFTPTSAFFQELVPLLAMLGAGIFVARIEQRRIFDYYLSGRRRPLHFVLGVASGFVALSALVGSLAMGGWLQFEPIALTGSAIIRFGFVWAIVFLLVGCVEEGIFRCYLQFTLARSINFWWALGTISVVCADLFLRSRGGEGILAFLWLRPLSIISGTGAWGVYIIALLGLIPCLLLQLKGAKGSGFWQAAWVTSTLFGFIHTGNNGENWVGILAAGAIGFVFVVSVRVTGSAWWAIGCHAAWDWAETYFYGTADSGLQAQGHLLTTQPAGNALWSGGTDGPEGSVLVLGIILLMLIGLLVVYGRRKQPVLVAPAGELVAG
jgi:membrane protease YdiL (CAAX protease family)